MAGTVPPVELDNEGDLDFSKPASLARLTDRAWCDRMRHEIARGSPGARPMHGNRPCS
jgi:hypothetical protein